MSGKTSVLIEDIVLKIFADTVSNPDSLTSSERKDLINFSLVCSSFRDPAMSYLWKTLNSLLPLIRLIPGIQLFDGYPSEYVRWIGLPTDDEADSPLARLLYSRYRSLEDIR